MAGRAVSGLVILALSAALSWAQQTSGYTGSRACSPCHKKLYDDYAGTAMGRSLSLPNPALAPSPVRIRSSVLDREFEVFEKDGVVYQSESQRSGDELVFRSTHRLEFAIGSGVNGITFVVRRGDRLFQAPLSYYARTGKWNLSPGYELADHGFSRPIAAACVACHSGQPQPVPDREGLYRDPPFRELAIGCENCHGPGEAHVRVRGKIVNPARLPRRLAEDICMNCHQRGDTRVLQPDRQHSDFRPGAPLHQTLAILKLPLQAGAGDGDLLEHHHAMKLSRCYQASGGKLSCLTCHNPHRMPKPAETAAWYRTKCLGCHADGDCKLPRARRGSDDCSSCHMPKRAAQEISHSALTNHRIPVRPAAPLPDAAFEQPGPKLPGLIWLNAGPEPLPLLTKLSAYGELMSKEPSLLPRYLAVLEELKRQSPGHPLVLAALGRKALRESDGAAVTYLAKAIEQGSRSSSTFLDLAEAYSNSNQLEQAIAVLDQGIELHPYSKELRKLMILRLISAQRYDDAKDSMKRYLEIFPEDSFLRSLLQKVEPPGRPR